MNPNPHEIQPHTSALLQRQAIKHEHDDRNEYDSDDFSAEDVADSIEQEGGDSRKRQRPMNVSCQNCKQRKVRCDRGQPQCGWCTRNRQSCEYKARKKPGLRAGYGRELERRLDRIESLTDTNNFENRLVRLEAAAKRLETVRGFETRIAELEALCKEQRNEIQEEVFPRLLPLPSCSSQRWQPPTEGPFSLKPDMRPPGFPHSASTYKPIISQVRLSNNSSMFENSRGHDPSQFEIHGVKKLPTRSNSLYSPVSIDQASNISSSPYGSHSHVRSPTDISQTPSTVKCPVESPTLNISPPILGVETNTLPNLQIQRQSLQLYFIHIHPWCPILHPQTIWEKFNSRGKPDSQETYEDIIVLHAVVAITMRFFKDTLNDADKERHRTKSADVVKSYGMEHSSVTVLQAMVILALDIIGSQSGPPVWKFLAVITETAVHLDLTVDKYIPDEPDEKSISTMIGVILPRGGSWLEDECRRRLFWMIYLLDRYARVVTAFDFKLGDGEIARRLPCKDIYYYDNNEQKGTKYLKVKPSDEDLHDNDNLGSFAFYIEAVHMLSLVHNFLREKVNIADPSQADKWWSGYCHFDQRLNKWKAAIPAAYGLSSQVKPISAVMQDSERLEEHQRVILHAAYHTTVIRLHSSAAYPKVTSVFFEPSKYARQRCREAVGKICELTEYVVDREMIDELGPLFAFSVWVAARILVIQGLEEHGLINPDIVKLTSVLKTLGYYWEVARRYGELIERVCHDVGLKAEGGMPATAQILADMRRCAYDLMFSISKELREDQAQWILSSPV